MSDAGAGDFRGSKEERKKDETVMISADDLSSMVGDAKADAPAPAAPPAPDATDRSGPNPVLIGVIGLAFVVVVVLAIVILGS